MRGAGAAPGGPLSGAGARRSQERREGLQLLDHKLEEIQAWPQTHGHAPSSTHFVLQVSSGSASPTSFHVFSGKKVPESFRGKRLHVVGKPQNQQGEETVTLSGKRRNEALGD